MIVDSILPHAESGPNDHRKDAHQFNEILQKLLWAKIESPSTVWLKPILVSAKTTIRVLKILNLFLIFRFSLNGQ